MQNLSCWPCWRQERHISPVTMSFVAFETCTGPLGEKLMIDVYKNFMHGELQNAMQESRSDIRCCNFHVSFEGFK